MAFTYNLTAPNDITRVRFAVGDNRADAPIYDDDEITFILSEVGSWQRAVIACLRGIITRISAEPDTQADWLRVEWGRSMEGYRAMLEEKKSEYGLQDTIVGLSVPVYRSDSLQTDAPEGW